MLKAQTLILATTARWRSRVSTRLKRKSNKRGSLQSTPRLLDSIRDRRHLRVDATCFEESNVTGIQCERRRRVSASAFVAEPFLSRYFRDEYGD